MTTYISPITDRRKRDPNGRVIKDGEAIAFNIALVRDAAPAATANLVDSQSHFNRSRALAAARYQDSVNAPSVLPGLVTDRALMGNASAAAHRHEMAKLRTSRYQG